MQHFEFVALFYTDGSVDYTEPIRPQVPFYARGLHRPRSRELCRSDQTPWCKWRALGLVTESTWHNRTSWPGERGRSPYVVLVRARRVPSLFRAVTGDRP